MIVQLERGRDILIPVSTQYLGKRIFGEFSLYDGSQSFYKSTSGIMMIQGRTLSYMGDGSDLEEVFAFASFLGVRYIESEAEFSTAAEMKELHLMKKCRFQDKGCRKYPVRVSEDIFAFAQFMHVNYPETDMGFLYPFLVRRVRRGMMDVIYIRDENGDIRSGCMMSHFGDISYISAVFTAPEHRGRGLASAVIEEAVNIRGAGDLFLCCEEDMKSYYEKLGFERTGSVYRYTV